jgi:hypothetical protein
MWPGSRGSTRWILQSSINSGNESAQLPGRFVVTPVERFVSWDSVPELPDLRDQSFYTWSKEDSGVLGRLGVLKTQFATDGLDLATVLVNELLGCRKGTGLERGEEVGLLSSLEALATAVNNHARVVDGRREGEAHLVVHDALSDGGRPAVMRNVREAEIRIGTGMNGEVFTCWLHLTSSRRRLRSNLRSRHPNTEVAQQKYAGSKCEDLQSGPACSWGSTPHDSTSIRLPDWSEDTVPHRVHPVNSERRPIRHVVYESSP